jgi:hypothetical protein
MLSDYEPLFAPCPFWFANPDLLTEILRAEINAVSELLAKYPDLPNLFDSPDALLSQRSVCFALLAHRKLIEVIDNTFTSRYEQTPALSDVESETLRSTYNLVAADAPVWVSEMYQVVQQLPARINASLPKPLQPGGYNHDNAEQMGAIQSAVETLSSIEQIQVLTERVLDQQLQRLVRRWSATIVQIPEPQIRERKKRNGLRTRDKLRMRRDQLIAEIDDVAETNHEFLQLMDERNVKPQPTWSGWPGSWSKAYQNPRLRELIHKDKSRALGRVRRERKR